MTDCLAPERPLPTKVEPGAGRGSRRWFALGLLGTAFAMPILGATSVFTAAPSIADDLGFSAAGAVWLFTAFAVPAGGLLLFGGRVADRLGRRRVFMTGVGLFVAASLLCGVAWSGGVLVAARAVQGASEAVMAPAALALLMTTFEEGPARNKALAVWSAIGGSGATAGLLLGGPVTDVLGWEWIFLLNVPVGLAVLALSPVLLRESSDRERTRTLDPAGAVTITAALIVLVYAIVSAPEAGWAAPRTIGLLSIAAALVATFVAVERRSAAPLVPLRIFRSRSLVGGNLVLISAGMAVDGMLFTLTLYAQRVLGYSALQFGLVTAVMTAMSVVGAYVAQRSVSRIGFRPVAVGGMILIAAGGLLLTRVSVAGGSLDVIVGMLVFGTGLGAAFVAATIAALTGVAERDSGLASGLQNTSFAIGTGLGVAVVSTAAVAGADGLLGGIHLAFGAVVAFAAVGLVVGLVLLGRSRRVEEAYQ